MTYFDLRKRDAEAEPETADVDCEPEAADDDSPDASHSFVGALWAGISGPGAWLAARGRPGLAWLLYVGSAWAAGHYRGWVAFGLVVAWLAAVLAFTPREFLDRAAAAIERLAARFERRIMRRNATPSAPRTEGDRDGILRLLHDLIGEERGVHLRTVLAHLQQEGHWEGRTVSDLRQHLEALGIPVRPKVKVAGTPTRGVLLADLNGLSPAEEALSSLATSPPV